MTTTVFQHHHAAHCESGAFAALLRHRGLALSEAMVFGIGSGLFFLWFPFIKLYGAPLVAWRDAPNTIIARGAKRLGVRIEKQRFRDEDTAMRELDSALASGVPVGLQTGVFWLPYFPRDMRFQFNGHHVIAYGRVDNDYLLSDTVFEAPVRCAAEDLRRARFSRGPLAPRGLAYQISHAPMEVDLVKAVRAGLTMTVSRMLRIPVGWIGIRGMRNMATALAGWPQRAGAEKARHWLANAIRMQEEIGTGGGGFRLMYAAFLEEAAELLTLPALRDVSDQFAAIGDGWREFAVAGAQAIKAGDTSSATFASLADRIRARADEEERALRTIDRALRTSA